MTILYRVSAGELPPEDWQHDPTEGGGRLKGEVCHFTDCVQYLAASPITSVHCAGYSRLDLPRVALDNLVLTLECADGSVASIAYVASSPRNIGKERIELFCAAGVGVLHDYRALEIHRPRGSERLRERTQDKGHRAEVRAFIESLRTGVPPVALTEVENSSSAASPQLSRC